MRAPRPTKVPCATRMSPPKPSFSRASRRGCRISRSCRKRPPRPAPNSAAGATFILVDPLDGTREFLARNGEFTVNLGLIIDGVPRAGVVYAPALGQIWIAGSQAFSPRVSPGAGLPPPIAAGSFIRARAPADGLVALASRSHADPQTEAYLAQLPIKERQAAGSSLKFCRIAEGVADVYPRFGPTMEWDTAAGDAVLRAAGGIVLRPERAGPCATANLRTGLQERPLSPGAIRMAAARHWPAQKRHNGVIIV